MRTSAGLLAVVAVAWVLAVAGPAPAAPPADDLAALIRDLGSSRYSVRERASRRLWELGPTARAALARATRDTDPEVRARARTILADVDAGIRPDWPREVIDIARGFEATGASQRKAALDRICESLKSKALGFVLWRLAAGDAKDANHALACLKKLAESDRGIHAAVVQQIPRARNDYEGQALARAWLAQGEALPALKILVQHDIGSSQRTEIIEAAVKDLLAGLARFEFRQVADKADQYTRAAPAEARFLYLQAEALAAMELGDQARALRARALALHPQAEAPHYKAGEMLQHQLGRREMAAREWKKILAIKPSGEVYDMNALIRLHSLCAESGRYGEAAEHLERAVTLIEASKRKHGGVGIVGATTEGLRERAVALQAKARPGESSPAGPLPDRRPDGTVSVSIRAGVKDGKLNELRRALGQAVARATINVQPRGLRLFDKDLLSVRYDPVRGQLGVFLNNSPCARPVPLRLPPGREGRVAIRSLDCFYIFQVNPAGGPAKKLARYECDYLLVLRPGNIIAGGKDLAVTVNGKAHPWKTCLTGLPLDYLPAKLDIRITGTRPSGRPLSLTMNITPNEPDITPLPPASPATRPAE